MGLLRVGQGAGACGYTIGDLHAFQRSRFNRRGRRTRFILQAGIRISLLGSRLRRETRTKPRNSIATRIGDTRARVHRQCKSWPLQPAKAPESYGWRTHANYEGGRCSRRVAGKTARGNRHRTPAQNWRTSLARTAGLAVHQPARIRARLAVRELRLEGRVCGLRTAHDPAPNAGVPSMPSLRQAHKIYSCLPRLFRQRPHIFRRWYTTGSRIPHVPLP